MPAESADSGTGDRPQPRAVVGAPVVEAIGVTKRYGPTVALQDAGITVLTGQTHALVGRNGAGKSTLVSIITGLQAPDAGGVRFGGQPAPRLADREAWRQRVACVYQKSTVIPELTVAENLFINRHDRGPGRLIRWRSMRERARELLATWSVDVDVNALAGELSVEQRQFVEIARALSFGSRFIVLDEPTAQLDAHAIERLFDRIRGLQRQGVTFLFISHHLQEIYDICDTVTVFRDARHILTAPVSELPRQDLVAAMTGEAGGLNSADAAAGRDRRDDVVLDLARVSGAGYADVSFQVRGGEIVGLAGSAGSGKTELAETVVGLRQPSTGAIAVGGQPVRPGRVDAALAAGVGFVPQDRHWQGFVPGMSVADNATMTVPDRLGSAGFISRRRRDGLARELIRRLDVKTSGPDQPVADLSGGNQQKVVMARALANDPRLLLLITPTAGVDVRSKEFLLQKVESTAAGGAGVVIASDELDDLRVCDRVLVMFHGRIVTEMQRGWRDSELVAAMEGLDTHD